MYTLLVVEDDEELNQTVSEVLSGEGYRVLRAHSCREAQRLADSHTLDLAVLDVNLPDGSGFAFMETLRKKSRCPVLFLSARDEDEDRLQGLGLGADDYVTKPFLMKELILRVTAILRRSYYYPGEKEAEDGLQLGACLVDFAAGTVRRDGQEISLTAKELLLLKKLADNRGNIVTIDALCAALWDGPMVGYENTLMVHIRRLREKIEADPSHPRYLLTVRGLGYRLAREEQA